MKFTYEAYENLMGLIRGAGYSIVGYDSYKNVDRPCILRHDVDMTLELASKFANFEASLKEGAVQSTYFVLLSSDFYNPYSKENIQHLRTILKSGHNIGLHFDEKKYMTEENFDAGYLKECVKKESNMLAEVIEAPITSVSMHRPSKKFLAAEFEFPGMVNSYSKTFFNDFRYVSDSRMNWREDVEMLVSSKKENGLHILTHPIWYAENERTLHDIMKMFMKAAVGQRYMTASDNLRSLDEIITLEEVI